MMVRGKLILICQFGGNIVKNNDDSLSYAGGDANALNINNDTLFSDLKFKLAEVCNMELKSIYIKYFLPGNRLVLINLSSDKDLKRMLMFHNNSVTADVFVFGKEGFDRDSLKSDVGRLSEIKLAETVPRAPVPDMTIDRAPYPAANPTVSAAIDHENPLCTGNYPQHVNDSSLNPTINLVSTPAETVKRRRRCVEEKVDVGVPENAIVDDVAPRNGSGFTKRRKLRNRAFTRTDELEEHQEILIGQDRENDIKKLVASWKEGIDGPGQEFESAYVFCDALQKYAVAHQFRVKFKKNDANRVNGRCAAEGCSWKIHASWVPQAQAFRIKKMNKTHTCGGETWQDVLPAKAWLVNMIKKRLHSAPNCKPKDIATEIAKDFGMELKYAQVWRGIKDAKAELFGSKKESYNQLPLLCSNIVKMNPGSVVKLFKSDDNRFQRLFLCFHATIHGFRKGCRPLLFLDSILLRSKYKESLLVVSAVDGNDSFFPVAIALVDVENDHGWIWFLDQLKAVLSISSTAITFISDREKCLQELVLRVFENAEQGYSMYHLIESFIKNLKGPFYGDGRGSLLDCLMAAALANDDKAFKRSLEHIKQVSPNTHDWFLKIDPQYWANALFKGERYNHITDSAIEPLVELLEGTRELPLKRKIQAIVQMMGDLMNSRRTRSKEWNSMLTPTKETWLERETLKASKLQVLSSSESVFEVRDETINVVNVKTQECSCREWKATGIPCFHAIAVFKYAGLNVYDFCSKYFTVVSFKSTYSESINPVLDKTGDEEYSEDAGIVLPPRTSRHIRQENVERTRPKGSAKRLFRCSKCKAAGHYKATCKADV